MKMQFEDGCTDLTVELVDGGVEFVARENFGQTAEFSISLGREDVGFLKDLLNIYLSKELA